MEEEPEFVWQLLRRDDYDQWIVWPDPHPDQLDGRSLPEAVREAEKAIKVALAAKSDLPEFWLIRMNVSTVKIDVTTLQRLSDPEALEELQRTFEAA